MTPEEAHLYELTKSLLPSPPQEESEDEKNEVA
jgi:hypothetical protein